MPTVGCVELFDGMVDVSPPELMPTVGCEKTCGEKVGTAPPYDATGHC